MIKAFIHHFLAFDLMSVSTALVQNLSRKHLKINASFPPNKQSRQSHRPTGAPGLTVPRCSCWWGWRYCHRFKSGCRCPLLCWPWLHRESYWKWWRVMLGHIHNPAWWSWRWAGCLTESRFPWPALTDPNCGAGGCEELKWSAKVC